MDDVPTMADLDALSRELDAIDATLVMLDRPPSDDVADDDGVDVADDDGIDADGTDDVADGDGIDDGADGASTTAPGVTPPGEDAGPGVGPPVTAVAADPDPDPDPDLGAGPASRAAGPQSGPGWGRPPSPGDPRP